VALAVTSHHLNHVGTVHAAAQFGLAEAASGATVVSAFADALALGLVPLAARAEIAYRKPAQGDLLGVATLASAEQQRIRAEVAERGRSRFTVSVQILDSQGALVSEVTVQWVVLLQS
jgi:acyl-CoA thioesterase FadM